MTLNKQWRRRQAIDRLVERIAAMPDFSIYREMGGGYIIFVEGQERRFASEIEARMGQLRARAAWLRSHSTTAAAHDVGHTGQRAPGATRRRLSTRAAYPGGRNAHGCPLLNQAGADGIRDFARLLAALSPEERAAFERERRARRAEVKEA